MVEAEGIIRVYFSSWDENQVGRIGYVDLDIHDPKKVLYVTEEPVLDVGGVGMFDEYGVAPSCVLSVSDKKHLYYQGFQRTEKEEVTPLFIGLAISDSGGRVFRKFSRVPVLDRTPDEPSGRSAPFVCIQNSIFRMWYVSHLEEWVDLASNRLFSKSRQPKYVIKHTESSDGVHWSGKSHTCIDLKGDEFGLARPWVVKDSNIYKMWYAIRSITNPYRLGYAESDDGLNWVRKDGEVGIQASETGWDSEMICFPSVVEAKGKRYMFYNGNRHGKTGFGYAELEER